MEIDTEIYEPQENKQLESEKFYNVIVVKNNRVIINNLHREFKIATNNFINLIREFSEKN